MAKLNIQGQTVTVSDDFYSMSTDEQNKAVEEIASSLNIQTLPSKTESFARGAADMGTFGFADEIGAGIETGAGLWGDYDKELQAYRDAYARAQQANPKTYLAGQVAGGVGQALATAGLGSGVAAANLARAGMATKMIAGAGYGAGTGATYGFGSGEGGIGNRISQAGVDAAFGAAGGAIGAPVGAALAKGASKAGGAVLNAGRRFIGPKATGAEQAAAKKVSGYIDDVGLTVDEAIEGVKDGRFIGQQDTTLMDRLRSTKRSLPGRARSEITKGASRNFADTNELLKTAMREGMGGEENSYKWLQKHKANTKIRGAKAYREAFRAGGNIGNEVEFQLLSTVDMKTYKAAQRMGGPKFVTLKQTPEGMRFTRPVTLEEADIFYRALRDQATSSFDSGYGASGSHFVDAAKSVKVAIDRHSPELAQVRARYSDDKAITDAFNFGKKSLRGDVEEVEAMVSEMGSAEFEAWRKGVWSAVRREAGRTNKNRDLAKRFFQSDDVARVIELATPDRATAGNVQRLGQAAGEAAELRNTVRYGTQTQQDLTDNRLLNGADRAIGLATSAAAGDTGGMIAGIVGAAKALFRRPPSDAELTAIGKIMLSQDAAYVERLLKGYREGDKAASEQLRNMIAKIGATSTQRGSVGGGDAISRDTTGIRALNRR